jgi:hypothetical protein
LNLFRISGSSGSGAPYAGIKKASHMHFVLIFVVISLRATVLC